MRGRGLLATFLLGVVLCFVPALGYGEVRHRPDETEPSFLDYGLLKARVDYIMRNPTIFLDIAFYYDVYGLWGRAAGLPQSVDTKGKIYVIVRDSRDVFSYKSGISLREEFKKQLEVIYSYIESLAMAMDTDIAVKFVSRREIPLGYFYQGEYHLWGE